MVPGIVNWKLANKPPIKMPFKKVENCNQVIRIGKQLKFSLVNVAGNDFVQGNKNLILSFLCQLMCQNILQLLKNLRHRSNGKEIRHFKRLFKKERYGILVFPMKHLMKYGVC